METRQIRVPSNQISTQSDSLEPIFSLPPSASQPPPAQSFSPTPSPPRELSLHQLGEILPQGNHPVAVPTGAMVNSFPAPSGRPWTVWTSEPSAFDAESSPVARRNQQSVQPLQQQDHRAVPAEPQLQLPMRWTVPDTAQSIAFALKGNIDGLKYLFS
jgi:hypothetical protein